VVILEAGGTRPFDLVGRSNRQASSSSATF
jgi:hypothetical protein